MDTIKIDKKSTKMIAHRGLSAIECENTNAAFVAAGNRSYCGIETDVHMTADGRLAVMHDDNIERMSGHNIVIEEATYDELKDITLYDREKNKTRGDLRIPLLSEYIGICKRYDKTAVIEIKNSFTDESIKKLMAEADSADYLSKTIFISFVWDNLVKVRALRSAQSVQFLCSEYTDALLDRLIENRFDIDIYYKAADRRLAEALHKNNLKVNCWTCDEREAGEGLAELGVDFITTNILE